MTDTPWVGLGVWFVYVVVARLIYRSLQRLFEERNDEFYETVRTKIGPQVNQITTGDVNFVFGVLAAVWPITLAVAVWQATRR